MTNNCAIGIATFNGWIQIMRQMKQSNRALTKLKVIAKNFY